jgi:hypothetical protein
MSTNNLEKSSMALLCLHIDSKYKKKANGYFAQNFKYLTGPRLSHNPIVGQMVATATRPRQSGGEGPLSGDFRRGRMRRFKIQTRASVISLAVLSLAATQQAHGQTPEPGERSIPQILPQSL